MDKDDENIPSWLAINGQWLNGKIFHIHVIVHAYDLIDQLQ